jgi:methylenetetrahydrofolate--tRNA-(uracil-5-)-methyltransferase
MTTSKSKNAKVTIVGAGLAGSEALFQLLRKQIPARLIEMRPKVNTGAHTTDLFGELVCSNSVGSNLPDRAPGLLKEEMRFLGSYFMETAYKYRVPAGNALAVDRFAFSREMTRYLRNHSLVDFVNDEAVEIPENDYVIIATGPLTSPALLNSLQKFLGKKQLEFYDAIAPIVTADSINMDIAFKADRYGDDAGGDYINCPMNKEQYVAFVTELVKAERIPLSEMEKNERKKYFTACQPVEVIGDTGIDSLRFGALKPVGFEDPKTGKRPYAVVQLRQDNLLATMYNLVGFQTNLKFSEQERVFRMIPGLENAQFERLGQMHRNSYINSPELLTPTLQLKSNPKIFIAGQLSGVEGYTESAVTGLVAGMNVCRIIQGKEALAFPKETMIGALINYITYEGHKKFQPMNINFGLFPSDLKEKSDEKKARIIKTARKALREFLETYG